MQIFEYPYIIITILVMLFLLMGIIGLYFTMKSVLTSKETVAKGFSGLTRLEHEFAKDTEDRKKRCVIYISLSLDGVKRLHSEYKAGRIYEQVKRVLLRYLCRDGEEYIAIYGQESFLALNELPPEDAEKRIALCYDGIQAVLLKYGAVNQVPLHFGYLETESTEVTFRTAMGRAKQACSMAEDQGEIFLRWESDSGKEFERKLKIENSIQSEIENNRFFLEYQPMINAATNEMIGAEVLSRLNSPTEGIISPRVFLEAVNNVGINQDFDYYIFEKNCKWIASDPEKRQKYVYTINFSRHTLCDPRLAEKIVKIMDRYGIKYSCVAVEILEDWDPEAEERATMIRNLSALKRKGILLLLDDFGNGYTSFGDLMDMAINMVKIDRSIIRGADDHNGFLILKNMIRTAHDLGYRTVCEGIETEEQRKIAVEAGCDILQGYYFYRPMAVAKFESLVEK